MNLLPSSAGYEQSPISVAIDELWERRAELSPDDASARASLAVAIDALDAGSARVAWVDPENGEVTVDERAMHAIALASELMPMVRSQVGDFRYYDRIPLTSQLDGVRAVAGSIVRWGAYVAPGAVLMPSFIDIGAYVDTGAMVDTWVSVGSAAQVGKNVHLSSGAVIGGIGEGPNPGPPNPGPVVIENDALIGSRCVVAAGARVRAGAVLGAGTILTGSSPVIDATTGQELARGQVPSWSVAVGGVVPRTLRGGEFGVPCVLVLGRLSAAGAYAGERAALNDILREYGVNA
jgi:2,3,4,5-tetrahydropyridine-2-carboxylate N-succinyltransferase